MSDRIHELLYRNLQEVFGEGDATRRRAAIEQLYTSDGVLYAPHGVFVGRDALDRVAGELRATHPHFAYAPHGEPLKNPIAGQYYDWPVGYRAGLNLSTFWKLEGHKLGELTFTHFPDGTAHKNRMQGNDFVQSLMYARGVTCFSCRDPHGSDNEAMLRKPINEVCLSCHGPNTQNGPHAISIEAHTHHKAGGAGDQCVSCHMPKIEQTIGKVNVASHTFRFVSPSETDKLGIPNACNTCHRDKTTRWATAAIRGWSDRSPWRVSQ